LDVFQGVSGNVDFVFKILTDPWTKNDEIDVFMRIQPPKVAQISGHAGYNMLPVLPPNDR
jgi:hypothetical protein